MSINVKIGVDIGRFTSGIREGQQILKGLNAEMKASDAAFKATGNAEQKLNSQTKTLNSTLNVQKGIADQARQALDTMTNAGVKPADAAYQKMYVTLMNAEAGANEAQAALNALGQGAAEAAGGADQLSKGLNGISKKISLDQVISGIDKITGGLANAAKKAVQLGEELWNSIMDSAAYADDISTMATRMGLTNDEVQRMIYVADRFEAPAEQMAKTWKKLRMNMTSDSKDVAAAFQQLRISTKEWGEAGQSGPALIAKNYMDVFWEVGDALMHVSDASEQERLAQTLLGRSWDEMIPLFKAGRKAYEDAMANVETNSDEAIESAASLKDRVAELEKSWANLKLEVIGAIAPALEKGADALGKVLDSLTEYLKTPEGKKLLESLGSAVSDMLGGLSEISAEDIVSNFSSLLSSLTEGLDWISKNGTTVTGIIEGLALAFAGLKISAGVLEFVKIVSGARGLFSGGAESAAAAGRAAGSSWGSAFANAAMKAAPFLAFLYTFFENAITPQGNDDLIDENGNVTELGKELGITKEEAKNTLDQQKQIADSWEAMQERTGLTGQQVNQLKNFWSFYKGMQKGQEGYTVENYNESWANLQKAFEGQEDALRAYAAKMQELAGSEGGLDKSMDLSFFDIDKEGLKVPVIPEAKEGAAEALEAQIGELQLVAQVKLAGFTPRGDFNMPWISPDGNNANGIWSVPYDGYLARLHKNERVVPAREIASRSFSSNLYVENMNMGGGMSADALAATIAARNRRMMAGYGS